jgi:hypothetical protein
MIRYLFYIVFAFFLSSCGEKQLSWTGNHTLFEAVYYELDLSDTSNILTRAGQAYTISQFNDSLIQEHDTIEYSKYGKTNKIPYPVPKIDIIKISHLNPSIKEYYLSDRSAFKLVGYSTGDTLMPFTVFTRPLAIIPAPGSFSDSTRAIKQNWDVKEEQFRDETQIQTLVKLVKTLTLMVDGEQEEAMLYKLTLSGDAKVAYGEQQLLLPGAIFMQSKMLIGKTKGMLCEWSIKTRQTQGIGNNLAQQPQVMGYVQFIRYKTID